MDELFKKRLLVLVPFYPFKYSEKDLDMMDKDKDRLQDFWDELDEMKDRLLKMVRAGELEYWHASDILQYTVDVYEKVTVNYKNLQKGVEEMRKVKLIITEVDIMRDELIEKDKQLAMINEQLASKDELLARQKKELEEYRRRFGTLATI